MSKPIDRKMYKLFGSDCFGDFSMNAKCVYYSAKNPKSLSKSQRKFGYKWVGVNGNVIPHYEVERFEIDNIEL
jgi:hypothetical protein